MLCVLSRCQMGAYHTLDLELQRNFTISKQVNRVLCVCVDLIFCVCGTVTNCLEKA